MRDTFSYALLTEIGKVLIILTVLMFVQYVRHDGEPDASPRALSQAELIHVSEPRNATAIPPR